MSMKKSVDKKREHTRMRHQKSKLDTEKIENRTNKSKRSTKDVLKPSKMRCKIKASKF